MVSKTSDFTDEQLILEIRENNKELYSEVIRRYQVKLSHYLKKFFRNQDELEDVLQEVFIKVYRNLYGFDIEKKFSSWIYRITHNEAVNHLKKNYKKNISLDEQEWEIVDEKFDLNDQIDNKQLREKVTGALMALKEKYREPLILYYFEQKSYEEISDILRLPRSTVGVLIMRGKEKLKDSFKNLV
jgi:RNA polymerase sigma-70 factor (ECF subfamily)